MKANSQRLAALLVMAATMAGCVGTAGDRSDRPTQKVLASPTVESAEVSWEPSVAISPSPTASPDVWQPYLLQASELLANLGAQIPASSEWKRLVWTGTPVGACDDPPTIDEAYEARLRRDPSTVGPGEGVSVCVGTWLVSWDASEKLIAVWDRGYDPSAHTTRLTSVEARARLLEVESVLGADVPIPDPLMFSTTFGGRPDDPGGWEIDVPRLINDIPAESDGISDGTELAIYPDGTFRIYWYQLSPIGAMPGKYIDKDEARSRWCQSKAKCELTLEWWRETTYGALDKPLQLVWYVAIQCHWEWRDAVTGEIVGGAAC